VLVSLEGAVVLVVDDDAAQREQLAGFLADLGLRVLAAADGQAALDQLSAASVDVVLTDVRMPRMGGEDLLRAVRRRNPTVGVILVTAYGTIDSAVACLKAGAVDYLVKPLDLVRVEHAVRRALEQRQLERENRELRRRLGAVESIAGLVTTGTGGMSEVLSTIARVAPSQVSVLIVGESGTGKELVARALHRASSRREGPFVAVNAGALAPTLLESELFGHARGAFTGADRARTGRFEAAHGGTLFLDELGELPAALQVKLLRVLQERTVERVGTHVPTHVDVRIVAATHTDLGEEVRAGRFREDLYYRVAVVAIELPPLRRRRADVPLLVEHFARKHHELGGLPAKCFSREAMDLLVSYDFPGNVRELENIVQRALVLARGPRITVEDLPPAVLGARPDAVDAPPGAPRDLPAQVAALERDAIERALALEDGNQSRAAERLGISERALRYKRAKLFGEESS
jgi:DNA-binding NtrC family response regulator